jgi:hypothetical protein
MEQHEGLTKYVFHPMFNGHFWSELTSRVLEKPLKKFPEFYGNRRYITEFRRAHHWSPSCTT